MPKGNRKDSSAGPSRTANRANVREPAEPPAAFDLWLERGLHKLYDDIAQEPIPDALLDIIEQDRRSK